MNSEPVNQDTMTHSTSDAPQSLAGKIRVFHLVTGLGRGGTETMLLRLLPRLQESFENTVVCLMGKGPIGPQLEASGIPVIYLNFRGIWDLGVVRRYYQVLARIQPNVQINYLIHADLFGRFFGRLFGVKRIISSQRGSLLKWEFLRPLDRWTRFLVDHYVVQTSIAKAEVRKKLGLSANQVTVIPNGLDIDRYGQTTQHEARHEQGVPPDKVVITCVSKLRQGKGHAYLLAAFESLYAEHTMVELYLAGSGEEEQVLKDQVAAYRSRDAIHFLGDQPDVRQLLAATDIFILPTFAEGMSNALLEAMASQCAIITTDIPVNRELIQSEETGILVPAGDSQSLLRACNSLIESPQRRHELGRRAREVVAQRFTVDSVAQEWEKLIRRYG